MRSNIVPLLILSVATNITYPHYTTNQILFEIDQTLFHLIATECAQIPPRRTESAVQKLVAHLEENNYTITLNDLTPLLQGLEEIPEKYFSQESRTFLHDLALIAKAPQFFSSLQANNIIVCNDGCFGGNVVIDGNLIINGTANITGTQGPPGPQGPTGTCFQNNFAHVYDTTQQNAPLAFTNITMNTNGELSGWTHTPGSAILTCPEDGRYLIIYTAQASENAPGGNADLGFRMTLNGAPIDQSLMAVASEPITGGTNPVTRTFIQLLSQGDEIIFQFRADQTANVDGIDIGNGDVGNIVTGASFAVTITQITS